MSDLQVRIVELPPMQVISSYGFGKEPEGIAHQKMEAFLKSKGLWEDYGPKHRSFGFNNPNPAPGSPNYGYEIWVDVPPGVEPEGDLRLVEFQGGLYVVTRFENLEQIGDVWQALVKWRDGSSYGGAHHQWLEHLLNPHEQDIHKLVFDLYLPVAK